MNSNPIQFFTICARNYAAQAACLAESLRVQHPEAHFTAWLVDDGAMPEGVGEVEFHHMSEFLSESEIIALSIRYDLMELATAIKPRVFSHLFEQGATRAVYIDPDIYFFKPMTVVMDLLDEGSAGVLTPHMLTPIPKDGCLPQDKIILMSGVYNLGFLALSNHPDAISFTKWWWSWTETDCFSDHTKGVFTDQKWVNFAPIFWDKFTVLKDPALNVAYWNLHERDLQKSAAGEWQINGKPLIFFHFSGFNPKNPLLYSKHQTRFNVNPDEPLGKILAFYTERMFGNGFEAARQIKVHRMTFDDGIRIDPVAAELLYDLTKAGKKFETVRGQGPGSFREYLRHVNVGERNNNYITQLFKMRPDLRNAFDQGKPGALIAWIETTGRTEMDLEPRLLEDTVAITPKTDLAYVGFVRSELGIGEAARGYVAALRSAHYDPKLVDIGVLSNNFRREDAVSGTVTATLPDVKTVFLHFNADQLKSVYDLLKIKETSPDSFKIGLWAWETMDFPDLWVPGFELVDEIWAGSNFITESIAKKANVPVINIPYVVDTPKVEANREKFRLDPNEFVFLFTFDFHSFPERKNPYAALEAFRQAFTPDEPVRLLIKSMNAAKRPEAFDLLRQSAAGSRVTFLDEALDSTSRYELLASCDAYISLHRAEGFGLGMAEAMAYGKPVIATGWSGNMEFMTPWNSFPVDYTLAPLEAAAGPYPKGTMWAVPSIEDAAKKLRLVWEDKELREATSARAAKDIEEKFGPAAIGKQMAARLNVLSNQHKTVLGEMPGVPNLKKQVLSDVVSRPTFYLKKIPAVLRIVRRGGLRGLKRRAAEIMRMRG